MKPRHLSPLSKTALLLSLFIGAASAFAASFGYTAQTKMPPDTGRYSDAEKADSHDGPAALALFRWLRGKAFAPDGTLYLRDEHLVRRLDPPARSRRGRSEGKSGGLQVILHAGPAPP